MGDLRSWRLTTKTGTTQGVQLLSGTFTSDPQLESVPSPRCSEVSRSLLIGSSLSLLIDPTFFIYSKFSVHNTVSVSLYNVVPDIR